MTVHAANLEQRRRDFQRIAAEALNLVKETSLLLEHIARGLETFRLYEPSHQHAIEITSVILDRVRVLFVNHRLITIDVGLRRFLVNQLPIYEVQDNVANLHTDLRAMLIGGISFAEGVDRRQISVLMHVLSEGLAMQLKRETLILKLEQEGVENVILERPMLESVDEHPDVESADDDNSLLAMRPLDSSPERRHLRNAARIYPVAVGAIRDMMHAARRPDQINVDDTTRIAENLVAAVIEQPDAITAMAIGGRIDDYQYTHPVNVAIFGTQMARGLVASEDTLIEFARIALLYDIGKSCLPKSLFAKPGALTNEEKALLEKHPVISADLIDRIPSLEKLAVVVAFEHHVGRGPAGYPPVEQQWEPALETRIIRVAEAFDSLIANAAYRRTLVPHEAMAKLRKEWEHDRESALLDVLIARTGIFPAGSIVTLTNGEVAIVVRNVKERLAHPFVRVIVKRDGAVIEGGPMFQLGDGITVARAVPAGALPLNPMQFYPFDEFARRAASRDRMTPTPAPRADLVS